MILPPLEPRRLRFLTYNIHRANPPARPGAIDLEAIARVARDARRGGRKKGWPPTTVPC